MIRPPGFRGAVFGEAQEGNLLEDDEGRSRFCARLGITPEWATLSQVHGGRVVEVDVPGPAGEADAAFTRREGLPVAVRTADCVPVVLEAEDAVGIVHAGWRGLAAGVVAAAISEMRRAGVAPIRAAIGPAIGPCCYEVGPEVAEALSGFVVSTASGAVGVDLWAAAAAQLGEVETWRADACTSCDRRFHSHRRDRDGRRQVAVGWR